MLVKFPNRICGSLVKQLETLAWSNDEHLDFDEAFVLFYDDSGAFVGATKIGFYLYGVEKGRMLVSLHIFKFEVVGNRRGEGFGNRMFNWIVENYKPYMVELHHVDPEYDNGSSYRWWRKCGFRHVTHQRPKMRKIIK